MPKKWNKTTTQKQTLSDLQQHSGETRGTFMMPAEVAEELTKKYISK